jgi:hypothetical protein
VPPPLPRYWPAAATALFAPERCPPVASDIGKYAAVYVKILTAPRGRCAIMRADCG